MLPVKSIATCYCLEAWFQLN